MPLRPLLAALVILSSPVMIACCLIVPASPSRAEEPVTQHGLSIEGEPVQGALLFAHAPPGSTATVSGIPVLTTPDGLFLIGIHRDETGEIAVEATAPDGTRMTATIAIQPRSFDVQRINGLPNRMVTPDEDALRRIKEDQAAIRKVRETNREQADFRSGFIWPVRGIITGVYGSQRILNGEPRQPHYGVDIAAPTGTAIVAPADGVVVLAHPDMYFSGKTMVIDHGHGLQSALLHLDTMDANVGDVVKQGQRVGTLGASGRATGPHLDWRVNLGGKRIDAALLVPSMDVPTGN